MKNKILVLGSTGNVGSKLVKTLVEKNEQVKAAVRPGKKLDIISNNVEQVNFDYTLPDTYANAFEGVDRIFFLSAPLDMEAAQKINPFIDAAVAKGITRLVFLSAMGADKSDVLPLKAVEEHLVKSGANYTIVRPTFFMENFSNGWMQPMIKSGTIYAAAADKKSAFIASNDIAAVLAEVLTRTGFEKSAIDLTGPGLLTYADVASAISHKTGKRVNYIPITDVQLRESAAQNGLPQSVIEYLSTLYQAVSAGYAEVITPGVKNVTGKDPISFDAFTEINKNAWN